jgi:hypothetical protein
MQTKHLLLLCFGFTTCLFVQAQECSKTSSESCEKVVSCSKPKGADFTNVLASWKGSYRRNGTVYDVFMDVKRRNGEVISFISIPQLGIENQESRMKICCGNEIHVSPGGGAENVTIKVSKVSEGVLTGKVYLEENDRYSQYALAMNVIKKI